MSRGTLVTHANNEHYGVLVNSEGQYSLWPANQHLPSGWLSTGRQGTRQECLDYVESVWTDLRPRAPRAAEGQQAPGGPDTIAGLHELISAQAARSPHATAVSGGGRHLTYAELDRRSDEFARRLTALGVGAETVVGLCVARGPELVVGLLAVLKAGGAYLALDPAHPSGRLASLLADSGAAVLVTDLSVPIPAGWAGDGAPVAVLDRDGLPEDQPGPAACAPAPLRAVAADQLAYVIYTSGSSGTPKGVQVTHGAMVNLLTAVADRVPLTASDVLLAVTTISFDISVLELFAPLLVGGRVAIAERSEAVDGEALAARLAEEHATVMQATPATWQLLLDCGWRPGPGLTMLCGGEALPPGLAGRLLADSGRLWNLYGPTETTVWSSAGRVTLPLGEISLGEPLAGAGIHLLDARHEPVAPDEAGEIAIAGPGLARGYAGQPGLTADRFVANPFAERPGERLYRTGDLARRLPDGTLRYLGRVDDQVKVRGHRIEPREIEDCAAGHPLVGRAVATATGDSTAERRLVAALVPLTPAVDRAELIREVRTRLRETLPAYMVPDRILVLDAFPLSAAGKVDRRAVAELAATHQGAPGAPTPAANALERELTQIFCAILALPDVGVHDDFFELGGHSLLAARLVLRIQRRFGIRLPLAEFLQRATVASLAAAIGRQEPFQEAGGESRSAAERPRGSAALRAASGTGVLDDDPAADAVLDESVTPAGKPMARTRDPRRILLTGSTGYLGAHLLGELLERTGAEIVCLVRAPGRAAAEERQARVLRDYGLTPDDRRVTVLPGDLTRPNLGLPDRVFDELAHGIDVIYHCGSQVNLVLPFAALRAANTGGTREIVRLACQERVKPVHYVSTIGILRGTDNPSPWAETADISRPPGSPDGYVRSKWAAERVLAIAAGRGLPVTIHRPFLVMSHTMTGACVPANFLSIMLRAFLDLGVFPDCDALLDIVPVDFVSRAMVALCQDESACGGIYHYASPRPATFRDVHEWLGSYGYRLKAVPYRELRERLESLGPDHPVYGVMPLLQARGADREYAAVFNQSFSCTNTWDGLRDSGITCEPVGEPLVHRALSYLVETGFLEPPQRQRDRLRRAC